MMRTTLTLDDDLARLLERRARARKLPFKTIVNEALRRGLAAEAAVASAPTARPFAIKARDLGLQPGIDPQKLNQLADDLEAEAFLSKQRRARP
jgi:CTP:molybdopterin cytidylyltransferase MocA